MLWENDDRTFSIGNTGFHRSEKIDEDHLFVAFKNYKNWLIVLSEKDWHETTLAASFHRTKT